MVDVVLLCSIRVWSVAGQQVGVEYTRAANGFYRGVPQIQLVLFWSKFTIRMTDVAGVFISNLLEQH